MLVKNYLSNWRRARYILSLATDVNSCFSIIILKRWANIGQKNDLINLIIPATIAKFLGANHA